MVGASVLGLGEWFIKRMPLVRHIYIAFKQISASISPDVRSWASKKFMAGCDFLFPIAITFYITWWFIHFVDGFFSPIYAQLGIDIFGLGFITSITFIFMVGVFMSSWLGASVLGLGEWFIKRMPLVRHIYNASKQISAAISPDQNTQAFKEVAIIRHPRIGECAFGFITSSAVLQNYSGDEELCCVYVPTNQEFVTIREPLLPEELSLRKLKAKGVPSKTTKPREGSTNMGKEIEERVSKRVAKEERTKRLKEVVQLDAKEIMPIENEKASGGKVDKKAKVKTISRKPQNGSRINKNDIHFRKSTASDTTSKPKAKVKTTGKKVPEKEVSKSKIVTKPQDQGEISSAKLRNPQNGSRINKNEIHFKKSTASDTTSKSKNQKINISKEQKKNHMKKQRHVADPEAAKPVAEQFGEEEKIIDISCDDDCTEIRITTTIADDLAVEHEVNASANNTGEDCKQSKSCSGDDILMLKSEHENATFPAEEAHESTNCCETDHKPDKEGSELKYLLLTNQSFISNEEELLNLELDCPKILPKNETNETANVRLYLDCANELTERKSLQESQVVRPLLLTYDAGNSRLHISLGKLVEEICNAIENLTCYSEKSRKKLGSSDSIYAMTERDMKCNGLINGIWNWGWRHGFSADEAEQVVNEVENLVFSELIEEVIVNL